MRRPRIALPREGGARLLGTSSAARTPFVLLVVLLLGMGLLALLLLNAAVNQGSFRADDLKRETTRLTDEEQRLRQEIEAQSAPDALEKRARELGMVPGGPPVFLGPEGEVKGKRWTATGPPPPALRPAEAAEPSPDAAEEEEDEKEAEEAEAAEKAGESGEPASPAAESSAPAGSPSPSPPAPPPAPAAEEAP